MALWGGASSKSPPAPSSHPMKEAEHCRGAAPARAQAEAPQVAGLGISHMSRSVQQATLRAWAPGPSHRGGRVGGAWLWTTTEGQIYWSPWSHTWADCASSHQSCERRGMVPGPRPGADPRALPRTAEERQRVSTRPPAPPTLSATGLSRGALQRTAPWGGAPGAGGCVQ